MKSCCKNCGKEPTDDDKWRYTLYTALLFLIIVNPFTYQLTNYVFKSLFKVSASNGCPTMYGILLHSVVFTFALRVMMDMKL